MPKLVKKNVTTNVKCGEETRKETIEAIQYLGFPKLTASYKERLILCKKYLLVTDVLSITCLLLLALSSAHFH